MGSGLHAAGARGLQGAARVVQPDVTASHHLSADMDVVVLQEHQMTLELAVVREVDDLLDEALALVVPWMRLAGEDELHGAACVAYKAGDVLELVEDQRSSLVGGETPGEPDGQCVRIQQCIEGDEIGMTKRAVVVEQATPGELDQLTAESITHGPEFLVADDRRVGHFLPEFWGVGIHDKLGRLCPQLGVTLLQEATHRTFDPAHEVDAVGDGSDGDLFRLGLAEEPLPHFSAHLAVEGADAVGGAGIVEGQGGHAEQAPRTSRVFIAQFHQLLVAEVQVGGELASGQAHQVTAETVVSCFHRCVCGEDALLLGRLARILECLAGGHLLPDQFEGQERRVSLVHVEGGGLDSKGA